MQREEAAADERDVLQEQVRRQQDQVNRLQDELDHFKASPSAPTDSKRYQELETKYRQAKLERTELLRTQSLNSQKLLELSDAIKHAEALRQHLEREIGRMQAEQSSDHERLEYLERLVAEKDLNIQILQDELQALQLELLSVDDRGKALERENRQLVDRWLSKVNETVDKLNAEVQDGTASLVGSPPGRPPSASSPAHSLRARGSSASSVKKRLDLGQPVESLITAPHHGLLLPVIRGSLAIFDRLETTRYLVNADPAYHDQLFRPQFSLDADTVAAFCPKEPDSALLWSVDSCRILGALTGALGSPFSRLAPLPSSNNALIAAHWPATLRLYDVPRQFCLWSEVLDSPIVDISPLRVHNADMLAILLADGRVLLWDVRQRSVAQKSAHALPRVALISSDPLNQLLLVATDRCLASLDVGSMRMAQSLALPPNSGIGTTREASPPRCSLALAPTGDGKFAFSTGHKAYRGDILSGALDLAGLPHADTLTGMGWITVDQSACLVTSDLGGVVIMSAS